VRRIGENARKKGLIRVEKEEKMKEETEEGFTRHFSSFSTQERKRE